MTERRALVAVREEHDIRPAYRNSPIGDLLRYHNLGETHPPLGRARLLVAMCMDFRKVLRLPDNFAYVLRVGGANLRHIEFKVSFAIAVGGVGAVAIIGHDDCGMASLRLPGRREEFVTGLIDRAGWTRDAAQAHFDEHAPRFAISGGPRFVRDEARRLQALYPGVQIAPLFYGVRERALYQVV